RIPLREDTGDVACELTRKGVHGLHLYADYHGQDYSKDPKHTSTSLKEVHQQLVKEGLRDQVTIIASGGVTLAEHVPKAIICGADLVGIDTTVLVALQAEFLGETRDRNGYTLKPRRIDPAWGAQRLVNLFGVWHDQLIEILSAMGMRDVRRLRGDLRRNGLEYKIGDSGGGFDVLGWKNNGFAKVESENVDLSISLNKRGEGRKIEIPLPIYGGGMSFGSISLNFMLARARAAMKVGTYTCTGEGGYPDAIVPYRDHVITQVATGMFGVREETIQYAPIVEFKYAQGAKPGLGGHLLADKVTSEVAKMRESSMFTSLYSPFPFHSVYSVEDHKKHVDWIKTVNPRALVSVKVSTPTDVDMVAIGSYYAGANIIHIDGGYGGTGAAPEIAKKNIAMPVEYAIPKVHDYLVSEGVRDEITLMASGGIRTADDVAKAIALGADGCVVATADAVAVGCTHCRNCE